MAGEKASNFKESWSKLIRYCKPYMPMILTALILAIMGTVIAIIGPNQLSKITDLITEGIMTGIDLDKITSIALILCALYGLAYIFNYLQSYLMGVATQRVSKSLRTDISSKINVIPLKYFDNTTYGEVLSRVTNDVDTISQSMSQSVATLVTSITMLLGSLIMMLTVNVIMTIVAVVATLIGFGLMMLIISRSQKHFVKQQQELGKLNGYIEEVYSGQSIVKVYNGTKKAKGEFAEMNDNLFNSAWKSQFFSGLMMPLMSFIGNFGYVAVCVTGAALAMNGSITFGVIVAFMVYIRLFTNPLSQLAQAFTNLQSAAAAGERVFDFLEEEELEDEGGKSKVLEESSVVGNVTFSNVQFGYDPGKLIIHDFSAEAKAGEKVAIVGPTGAGKTTLVNLLMRFYEVNAGEILIDGVPIDSITRENVHDLFCMVLQDTWLFEGTIRENIVYGKEGVSDEDVIAACKAVGVDHFIRTLPKGYDSVINDKLNLSAGQKQLITIARAMVKDAPILILDEATSSVDTRTELIIQEAMDRLMEGRTSFVIAHRLSTIKNADMILVLRDGDIIESGNHDDLLAKEGFYAELYNSQFEMAS